MDAPPDLLADYHLGAGSQAIDAGKASFQIDNVKGTIVNLSAPSDDIDDQLRPGGAAYDAGSDEVK